MVETAVKNSLLENDLLKTAPSNNDWLTVAALGLIAGCMTPFDHEALGHGSACLLMGGHIRLLTSSLFHCDVYSKWIDFAGPGTNLLIGVLALIARILIPLRFSKIRLFLILITAFSFFWEGGYLIRSMHHQNGDLYFFAQALLGNLTVTERWIGAALGLALYLAAVRLTSRALSRTAPNLKAARAVARTAWLAATLGALIAGLAGPRRGLPDAIMEIGLAAFPLLIIPRNKQESNTLSSPAIERSYLAIALALVVFIVFIATQGRGIYR